MQPPTSTPRPWCSAHLIRKSFVNGHSGLRLRWHCPWRQMRDLGSRALLPEREDGEGAPPGPEETGQLTARVTGRAGLQLSEVPSRGKGRVAG